MREEKYSETELQSFFFVRSSRKAERCFFLGSLEKEVSDLGSLTVLRSITTV